MPPKRRINVANVSAKRARTSDVLGSLLESEEGIEFQNGLDWVVSELKKFPNKMKAIKAVLRMTDEEDYDKEKFFDPKLKQKSIQNIPSQDLKHFFSKLANWTSEEMRALLAKDSRVLHKMLMRVAVLPPDCPIGITNKEAWGSMMQKRMAELDQYVTAVHWDRSFQVQWPLCGLYRLLPPFVEQDDVQPEDHQYQDIECCGRRASLTAGGFAVRANWSLVANWSFIEAKIVHTKFPDTKLHCHQ